MGKRDYVGVRKANLVILSIILKLHALQHIEFKSWSSRLWHCVVKWYWIISMSTT